MTVSHRNQAPRQNILFVLILLTILSACGEEKQSTNEPNRENNTTTLNSKQTLDKVKTDLDSASQTNTANLEQNLASVEANNTELNNTQNLQNSIERAYDATADAAKEAYDASAKGVEKAYDATADAAKEAYDVSAQKLNELIPKNHD